MLLDLTRTNLGVVAVPPSAGMAYTPGVQAAPVSVNEFVDGMVATIP